MKRSKKIKIITLTVFLIFLAAFAKHRLLDNITGVGRLDSKQTRETSGIAASTINSNLYYIHNDSGDTSRFFAISPDGKLRCTVYFQGEHNNLSAHDCEDIAVGPGPIKGKSYVYIGDIGDNHKWWSCITVFRIAEQKAWATDSLANAVAAPIYLKYPDGAKDAETLMIDPIEKLIYIVTKRRDTVGVYSAPLNAGVNDTTTMVMRAKLFFPGIKPFKWITAGDISKDGEQVLLKSYEKVYYWHRRPHEHIWNTLLRKPEELDYKSEKQGEAIGFTPDGSGYYTVSEGVYAPLYYYKSPR